MNEFETKAAAMLAGRVVCGLRELTAEQRRHVLAHIQGEFCGLCGLDKSACGCFGMEPLINKAFEQFLTPQEKAEFREYVAGRKRGPDGRV